MARMTSGIAPLTACTPPCAVPAQPLFWPFAELDPIQLRQRVAGQLAVLRREASRHTTRVQHCVRAYIEDKHHA